MADISEIRQLGVTHKLSNCEITRVELDDNHYYFIKNEDFPEGQFCMSVTNVIDEAGPVAYGLREFWKRNSKEESEELLLERGNRGKKIHNAFEDLLGGLRLDLEKDYPSVYEKAAITTFVRCLKFLQPSLFKSELVVASPSIMLAGTLDFVGLVQKARLDMLSNPNMYLTINENGEYEPKPAHASLLENQEVIKVLIDWKTSAGIHYAHEKQVIAYREMYNESYAHEKPVTHCGIFRVSTRHKHGFEFKYVEGTFDSFKRLYDTYLDIHNGKIPQPPDLTVYPKKIQLVEAI